MADLALNTSRAAVDLGTWQLWLQKFVAGDEDACQEIWRQFGPRLTRLAEKNLNSRIQQRVGPEDIVQSACRSFIRRARDGGYDLPDSDSLWRLLCAITLNKARYYTRFHLRQRRGVDREANLDAGEAGVGGSAEAPTPAEEAEFADIMERLLQNLSDDERQVVQLKLEQHTNDEIAQQIGCSERTVRRLLTRVRSQLSRQLELEADS